MNNALMSASLGVDREDARHDSALWGRLVESSIGAHLLNSMFHKGSSVCYWRNSNREVDFVIASRNRLIGIEVKSSIRKTCLFGMDQFSKEFKVDKKLLIGGDGIPVEEFLLNPLEEYL